jgi:hypothetical protein
MKDEEEKNLQEDNSVVAETKMLTEKYNALKTECEEKVKLMSEMLSSKESTAETVSN